MALTNDILHPEEIPAGVVGTIEVDLNVERLSSTNNQLVVAVFVGAVIHFVATLVYTGLPKVLHVSI